MYGLWDQTAWVQIQLHRFLAVWFWGLFLFFFLNFYFNFFFKVFYFYFWDRERQSMNGGGAEREGDTECEAGSRLRAISPEPNTGLELMDREIVTWLKSDA